MLGTTNITTTLVGNELGVSTRDVGMLCSGARSGGTSGSAFTVVEAGGTVNEGYLIDGAEPYFNIWSNNSPGEWVGPNLPQGDLRFRLKRDTAQARYCFSLGNYRNYDHAAIAASSGNPGIKIEVGSATTQKIEIRVKLGSYDWKKVANATHVAAEIPGVVMSAPQPISDEWIRLSATITVNTSYPSKEEYPINIFIGTLAGSDFNTIGRIPADGTFTIEVWKPRVPATITVTVSGRLNVFTMTGDAIPSGGSYMITGKYRKASGVVTSGKKLTGILYRTLDQGGNEISRVFVTKDQLNVYESPTVLSSYNIEGDDVETFYVALDRVARPFSANLTYE